MLALLYTSAFLVLRAVASPLGPRDAPTFSFPLTRHFDMSSILERDQARAKVLQQAASRGVDVPILNTGVAYTVEVCHTFPSY